MSHFFRAIGTQCDFLSTKKFVRSGIFVYCRILKVRASDPKEIWITKKILLHLLIGFGHLLVTLKKWRPLFQKWPSLWNDEQMAKVIHLKWPSLSKFSKKFFCFFYAFLAISHLLGIIFQFSFFHKVTVTLRWQADGHVIRSDRHF